MNVEELNMNIVPLALKRVCLGLLAVLSLGAMAQNYPAKPIKVVVGYAAGGAVDIIARTVARACRLPWASPL